MNPHRPSRHYVRRIWQVPKDRGPVEYFATYLIKLLRKHGWPADWRDGRLSGTDCFIVEYKHPAGLSPGLDFWEAVEIAVRVAARAKRIEVVQDNGFVQLCHSYSVNTRGDMKRYRE